MARSDLVFIIVICILFFIVLIGFELYMGNKVQWSEELPHEENDIKSHLSQLDELYRETTDLMNDIEAQERARRVEASQVKVQRKYERGEFQAGMNLLVYGHPNISNAQEIFKELRSLGVNSVAITYPFFQSGWQADQVMTDEAMTPTLAEIKGLILSAHAEDLSVMLRPILDEQSIMKTGHWRGQIQPKKPSSWFESYRLLLLMYAELAQETNVEILNIGTEFNSLQGNQYSDEWLRIIEEIRGVYEGELIYSFNWDCYGDIPSLTFVSKLDYVGIDAYYPLDAPDGANVEELKSAWEVWMSGIRRVLGEEAIIVTEVGVIPITGAHRKPYVWRIPGGKLDWEAQANYYEAAFQVWEPISKGLYWWSVTMDESDSSDIDYSPIGTPTEEVLKQLFLNN